MHKIEAVDIHFYSAPQWVGGGNTFTLNTARSILEYLEAAYLNTLMQAT